MSSDPAPSNVPTPEPGDQLVGFLDLLAERLEERRLVETAPETQRWRLTAAGREALGTFRRSGLMDRDLVLCLHRLATACDLEVPLVP